MKQRVWGDVLAAVATFSVCHVFLSPLCITQQSTEEVLPGLPEFELEVSDLDNFRYFDFIIEIPRLLVG